MAKEKPSTKICKHCKSEIPYGAKVCPQCRKKQGGGVLKWIIIAVVVLVILGAVAGGGSDSSSSSSSSSSTSASTTKETKEEAPIEYTAYTVAEMMTDLDGNALKASDKYKDQYVEITGKLNVIDSDGKYISVVSADDEWAILGVQCYIKNDETKQAVYDMSIGDTVTIKGKITDVGEVMGYSLNIDEVVQ